MTMNQDVTKRDQGSGVVSSPAAIALLEAAGRTGVITIDGAAQEQLLLRLRHAEKIGCGGQGSVFGVFDEEHCVWRAIKVIALNHASALVEIEHAAFVAKLGQTEDDGLGRELPCGVGALLCPDIIAPTATYAVECLRLPLAMRPESGSDGAPCEVAVIQEMEYVDGQTLHELTVEADSNAYSPSQREAFAKVVLARTMLPLNHFSRNGLVHCDIKLLSLMLRGDGTMCIIDMGLTLPSAFLKMDLDYFEEGLWLGGTDEYLSWNARMQEEKLPTANRDWYALAIVLFKMLAGLDADPYPVESPIVTWPVGVKEQLSTGMVTLVERLLTTDEEPDSHDEVVKSGVVDHELMEAIEQIRSRGSSVSTDYLATLTYTMFIREMVTKDMPGAALPASQLPAPGCSASSPRVVMTVPGTPAAGADAGERALSSPHSASPRAAVLARAAILADGADGVNCLASSLGSSQHRTSPRQLMRDQATQEVPSRASLLDALAECSDMIKMLASEEELVWLSKTLEDAMQIGNGGQAKVYGIIVPTAMYNCLLPPDMQSEDPNTVVLIQMMEYVDGLTLYEVAGQADSSGLFLVEREAQVVRLVARVVPLLEHLAFCSLVFCDVKLDNTMMMDNGSVYFIDLVLVSPVASTISELHAFFGKGLILGGTAEYVSQQHLDSGYSIGNRNRDWFAMGVVMYKLLCGRDAVPSWEGASPLISWPPGIREGLSAPMASLVERLLDNLGRCQSSCQEAMRSGLIDSELTEAVAQIRSKGVSDKYSKTLKNCLGFQQGCVIAPVLLNVFIDHIVKKALDMMPEGAGVNGSGQAEGAHAAAASAAPQLEPAHGTETRGAFEEGVGGVKAQAASAGAPCDDPSATLAGRKRRGSFPEEQPGQRPHAQGQAPTSHMDGCSGGDGGGGKCDTPPQIGVPPDGGCAPPDDGCDPEAGSRPVMPTMACKGPLRPAPSCAGGAGSGSAVCVGSGGSGGSGGSDGLGPGSAVCGSRSSVDGGACRGRGELVASGVGVTAQAACAGSMRVDPGRDCGAAPAGDEVAVLAAGCAGSMQVDPGRDGGAAAAGDWRCRKRAAADGEDGTAAAAGEEQAAEGMAPQGGADEAPGAARPKKRRYSIATAAVAAGAAAATATAAAAAAAATAAAAAAAAAAAGTAATEAAAAASTPTAAASAAPTAAAAAAASSTPAAAATAAPTAAAAAAADHTQAGLSGAGGGGGGGGVDCGAALPDRVTVRTLASRGVNHPYWSQLSKWLARAWRPGADEAQAALRLLLVSGPKLEGCEVPVNVAAGLVKTISAWRQTTSLRATAAEALLALVSTCLVAHGDSEPSREAGPALLMPPALLRIPRLAATLLAAAGVHMVPSTLSKPSKPSTPGATLPHYHLLPGAVAVPGDREGLRLRKLAAITLAALERVTAASAARDAAVVPGISTPAAARRALGWISGLADAHPKHKGVVRQCLSVIHALLEYPMVSAALLPGVQSQNVLSEEARAPAMLAKLLVGVLEGLYLHEGYEPIGLLSMHLAARVGACAEAQRAAAQAAGVRLRRILGLPALVDSVADVAQQEGDHGGGGGDAAGALAGAAAAALERLRAAA
ncbi:hypothetical protein FOA52_012898 [Chlamydomonas sp. UWO 241]|nr:hypothetical protein FOA52_012898 [Chlamydomonas sp. UWO 241]